MQDIDGIQLDLIDLESKAWPYAASQFDGIVVCRYLHRPLMPRLIESVKPGGVLIYETFMQGQQEFGRPQNPDFLLNENELLEIVTAGSSIAKFSILAFEQGMLETAMLQRVCASRVI